jgi:sterol desaturase/sphingolipid hydroxylase (fatty acid hydroxylase superfamily)
MNKTDYKFYLIDIPSLLIFTIYMTLGIILLFLDIKKPSWYIKLTISKEHINDLNSLVPNPKNLFRTLLFNFAAAYIVSLLPYFMLEENFTFDIPYESSIYECIGKFVACMLVADCYFYHSHRLFHTNMLYTNFHIIHHQATFPYGLVTNYCHIAELFFINTITVFIGPIITKMSLPLYYLWLFSTTVYTMLEHSGFKVIFFMDPTHHYKHHSNVKKNSIIKGNFGLSPMWDIIYGTLINN